LEEPFAPYQYDVEMLKILERDKDRLSGRTPIDPGFPDESCAKIETWIHNGPCIGIKYPGTGKKAVTCSHPNNDPIMRLAADLDVHVYIHTWLKVGGTPRLPGGDNLPSESTPMDVAKLAERFPQVAIICRSLLAAIGNSASAPSASQKSADGIRRLRPHSGMVDYAMRELGADRLVWGGHGPSRSYATELARFGCRYFKS